MRLRPGTLHTYHPPIAISSIYGLRIHTKGNVKRCDTDKIVYRSVYVTPYPYIVLITSRSRSAVYPEIMRVGG